MPFSPPRNENGHTLWALRPCGTPSVHDEYCRRSYSILCRARTIPVLGLEYFAMASHSETGQSLRKVYHFTRTLNELGPLPRVLFRTAREITNRNFTVFMHWGIIIDDRIFELSGNSKSIDHRFVTNPLTAEEEATHQSKEYRGWTALSDARILEIGRSWMPARSPSTYS